MQPEGEQQHDAGTADPALGLTRMERWSSAIAIAAGLAVSAALIFAFWRPAPPSVVVMSTGPADGAYHAYGKRYREILARSGVDLVLLPSAGAVENLERLRTAKNDVTVAFVQGGLAQPGDDKRLVSLGAVAHEPLWVFHRAAVPVRRTPDLRGRRIAIGVPGGGTRPVAEKMLALNGLLGPQGGDTTLLPLDGSAAEKALLAGEIDAAMLVSATDAPLIQRLLHAKGIELLSVDRAEAYLHLMPVFHRVELPEGAADLAANVPPQAVTLLSVEALLVAREDIHPVVVDLLLDAAREVHGGGSMIRRPGEFPAADASEFPMSADADRFYRSGTSTLRQWLPYWAAVWLQRLLFFGLPLLAVGIPLLRLMPALLRWSIRRRIYRWYGELAFLEQDAQRGQGERAAQLKRLDAIEERINRMHVPLAYASEAYTLRQHIHLVRAQITR